MSLCDRCWKPYVNAAEHGLGVCPLEKRPGHLIQTDMIDFVAENAWREPRHFTSQKAYLKALDADGLMLKERKPTHGRCMDPYTLAAAKALLERRGTADGIETRVLDETLRVEAEA